MRSREWVIAETFHTPADDDLPEWRVRRGERGELTFVDDDTEAFIATERPLNARR